MKFVILDRDGTINQDCDEFVKTPDEWIPLPGALQAIARLNHAGWQVVVATNQSGLGRGLFEVAALNAMHTKMHKMLAAEGGRIEAIFYCPHTAQDACTCRKPLPGLFTQIGQRFGVSLKNVPTAGDAVRDMLAGAAAGCAPHWLLTGKSAYLRPSNLSSPSNPGNPKATPLAWLPQLPAGTQVHLDLAAFVDHLLQNEGAPHCAAS